MAANTLVACMSICMPVCVRVCVCMCACMKYVFVCEYVSFMVVEMKMAGMIENGNNAVRFR